MSIKDQVAHYLEDLNETELQKVAEYVEFLKFRARTKSAPAVDETQWAMLYAEFGDEDREMAEEGMADYAQALADEDSK